MSSDNVADAEQELGEQEDTLRIMLLGKSGAGKSSSGNTILGRQAFKSDMKLTRVTRHCEKEVGKVGNVPVAVIDTPGLFETDRNKEDIVREILMCVKLQEPGAHAFVFVVPLGRLTQEDQNTNALIETLFGPKVWDYTIVLFTHGDQLEGKTINKVISESDNNLRNFIRKCSGGFHVFNNKEPEDQKQVTSFIAKIQTLMALNGGDYYRNALYPEKERRIRERQESILAEKDAEIRRKEEALEERYKGGDLDLKKKNLWREEEDKARQAAEQQTRIFSIWKPLLLLVLLVLLILLVVLAVQVSPEWLLGLLPWSFIFFKMFPTISTKMPWLSKKTE